MAGGDCGSGSSPSIGPDADCEAGTSLLMVARLEVLQVATTVRLAPSQRVTKMIVNRGPGLREMMETVRRGVNPPGKAAIARTDQPRV